MFKPNTSVDGPKRPLERPIACCGALSGSGHSFQVQHFCSHEVGNADLAAARLKGLVVL